MSAALKNSGALKRAVGGRVNRMVGRMGPIYAETSESTESSPKTTRGALGRAALRIAPQSQKNPKSTTARNHMMDMSTTDATIAETGEGLRKVVGRMRGRIAAAKGGKIRKYAEGGKVGTAMTALRALAKKYQEALDSGDTALAKRLKRDYDLKLRDAGRSREMTPADIGEKAAREENQARKDKLATFSKGGKVRGAAKTIRARMDDLEGYIREGFGATREEAHANLRKEVAKDNGEDTVDALLKEHGVTYKRSKE